MPNPDLIRIVDGIARDKNIEREQVYVDIEQAVASGLRKQFNTEDTSEFTVTVERGTGDITVSRQGETVPLEADSITEGAIELDGFWAALLGALIISIVSWALNLVLPDDD